jgi:thiosulfate/3-mercaptopyruvate sulfurtransferase
MKFTQYRVKLTIVQYTTLIDAATLAQLIGKPGIAVVDCRFDLAAPAAGRQAYLNAHIPGASYADLNQDLSAPPGPSSGRHPLPAKQQFATRLGALGVDNDTQVVAYDQANSAFAARLWWMLRWLGHARVAVLDGGFDAWMAQGGPVQSGLFATPARRFEPRAEGQGTSTGAQVVAALARRGRLVVDARLPERYAGTVEPLDAVAGHVPGAVNHPFTANLSPDGRFLPQAELRRRWAAVLGDTQPQNVVAMCGSGVTACHNLLALEAAGLPGASLYAGSWSEWIQDPAHPVATGSAP